MKSIYRCDTCGQDFPNWEACHEHEKLCGEKHATGVRLAKEINQAIAVANEHGNVKIGVYGGDDTTVYRLTEAKYNAKFEQIELGFCGDDTLGKRQKEDKE